ncbi:hypothetical protein [Alcaligenes faecalis]|uniref:hypothetical protein n=1 Tax=Alcaligenes faecalis TaxID=511 RepID=UPI00203FD542|nr:hypothetical protein [Alcaligenes faecalis]MCM2621296.1 hypothetical protein [Alcaligenes faecalis]
MAKNDDEGELMTVDGVEVIEAPRPRLRIPLNTANDVQRELARLYRQMKAGQIPTQDGSRLAYVLNLLRQSIETGDLEARIQALEAARQKLGERYG